MTSRVRAFYGRLGPWPLFAAFALPGVAAIWLGLSRLVPLVGAIANGAPLITLSPRDAIGLPIGLALCAFAGMTISPRPEIGPRARAARRAVPPRRDWAAVLLSIAGVCIIAAVLASPITQIVVRLTLDGRGYIQCPLVTASRNEPERWARPAPGQTTLPCPRE